MCCLLTIFVFLGPRIGGIFWWIFQPNRWVGAVGAFDTWIWPVLGLIFLPFTTIMYVLVAPGGLTTWDWVFVGLSVVLDILSYSGGGYGNRNKIPGYKAS